MLEQGIALHRAVYAKHHGLELKSVPSLIRVNGEKLDCRVSNLAPKPPKQIPPNLVFVPDSEMRSIVTEYGEVLDPLLIPAKYVAEARRVGIRRSPDKHARNCRICQKQITTKEDFLAIVIQRKENSPPTKGFMHVYECVPIDQEVPNSLSLPECWKRSQEYRALHPELYPSREFDEEEYGYQDEDDDEAPVPVMVHVSSTANKSCPLCDQAPLDFEEACNHLILEHGLVCVHVGSETHRDNGTGVLMQSTVAVFSRTPISPKGNGGSGEG